MIHLSKRRVGIIFIGLLLLTAGLSWTRGNPRAIATGETNLTPKNLPVNPNPQDTGKIWGTVADMKTGEALPGANVIVKGTRFGAASDAKGEFFIVQLPPRKYTLEASMIGFENKIISNVFVKVNDSTRLDFKLGRQLIENPERGTLIKRLDQLREETRDVEKKMRENKQSNEQEEEPVFIKHDIPPEPVGGYEAIQKHFKYPERARKGGIEGRAMIWAKIGTDGKILITKVMKSVGDEDCDKAAMKAIKSIEWKPAFKDGKPIAVWIAVPFDVYANQEFIKIVIKSSNNIVVEDMTTSTDEFQAFIKERLKSHKKMEEVSISLMVDRKVTMGTVDDILKTLKELKIRNVGTQVIGEAIRIK